MLESGMKHCRDRMRELRAAREIADAADRRLLDLIRGFFPVGARVRWVHGADMRSGVVEDASGTRSHMLRFSVRGDASGRPYWVGADRLLSFAGL